MTSLTEDPEIAPPNRQPARIRLEVAVFCLLSSCAYRFTNEHIVRPEGIKTVAVEAIYDTSREVLAHELLWKGLQDAFASDGHLRVVPQASADALVRAHLKQASVTPSGSPQAGTEDKDPNPFRDGTPPEPGEFRGIAHTAKFRDHAALNLVVDIEVWNLRTRTLLLRQAYPVGDSFFSVYAGLASSTLSIDNLRYNEAVQARLKLLSENLARNVVRDLLIK